MNWRYDHREFLPPNLVQFNGKTYIVPGWRRVEGHKAVEYTPRKTANKRGTCTNIEIQNNILS